MSIALGSVVTDKLTGFTGTVTGRAEYLYGCVQILVVPCVMKDGIPIESRWIDEQRCGPSEAKAGGSQELEPPK